MPIPVRITTVVDNTARRAGTLGEQGLALWVEAGDKRILFDTGQGLTIEHNVGRLGIPLQEVNAIVLSHGHYDHTGGLWYALPHARDATLYSHPAAFEPRYLRRGEPPYRQVGIPSAATEALKTCRPSIVSTSQPCEVFPGVWATGEIPRKTSFESYGMPCFCDEACTRPDMLADDQALVIDAVPGLVVLLGCAHAGVVNTMTYVAELLNRPEIHAVIGGMHLLEASEERLAATADALERYQVQLIAPLHCTGDHAWAYFRSRFGERCMAGSVGSQFSFLS